MTLLRPGSEKIYQRPFLCLFIQRSYIMYIKEAWFINYIRNVYCMDYIVNMLLTHILHNHLNQGFLEQAVLCQVLNLLNWRLQLSFDLDLHLAELVWFCDFQSDLQAISMWTAELMLSGLFSGETLVLGYHFL